MKKRILVVLLSAALLICGSLVFETIQAATADAGTISDPLVTKGYVDALKAEIIEEVEALIGSGGTGTGSTEQPTNMSEVYDYIDDKLAAIAENGVTTSEGYQVIEVKKGQKVICEDSTEFIVRTGEMVAIGSSDGMGLPDITEGIDVKDGEVIKANHLLIVPKSDGRGILVNQYGFIMIKGDFTIK